MYIVPHMPVKESLYSTKAKVNDQTDKIIVLNIKLF